MSLVSAVCPRFFIVRVSLISLPRYQKPNEIQERDPVKLRNPE